jgi:acetyl esterase/lipase
MESVMHRIPVVLLSFFLLLGGILAAGPAHRAGAQTGTPEAASAPVAQQPSQPPTGPGGAEVAYDGLLAQHYGPLADGTNDPTGFWLFEPTQPRGQDAPTALPLVIFLHGFDVTDPEVYHAWIDHLVRRGAVLVFPDYQAPNVPFTPANIAAVDLSAPNVIRAAVHTALAELASGAHIRPDLQRVAVVGHSLGTLLATNYTAAAAAQGLPVPQTLLLAMPGCAPECEIDSVEGIPATTRVVDLVGNQDTLAGEETAKQIWARLGQVPADHKAYIRLIGDDHGQPAIVADHFVPLTTLVFFGASVGALNALDWYGTWKLLDASMSCAFAGQDCQYAFGDTAQQRFMGTWSDGTPVAEAQVVADPGTPVP